MTATDPIADAALFDVEAAPPVTLADRFTMPPFSVLDRKQGAWLDRRRRWLSLGIESEVGRGKGLVYGDAKFTAATMGSPEQRSLPRDEPSLIERMMDINGGTSVFDPVICELVYRWFSTPGSTVLDPFCGGSVRGIVAGVLERQYTGVDLRMEQIAANTAQANAMPWASGARPLWMVGDATKLSESLPWDAEYDLVFSCPPYADLERYSDDPADISTWGWPEFVAGHAQAIADACSYLRDDRYACWVIGDVRGPDGTYRGLPYETVRAFAAAGLRLINECIIVDPLGTAAVRSARPFVANRKVTRVHQVLYVFVKGDVRRAANWVGDSNDRPVV
jgi:hypothetical protein